MIIFNMIKNCTEEKIRTLLLKRDKCVRGNPLKTRAVGDYDTVLINIGLGRCDGVSLDIASLPSMCDNEC